MITHSNINAVLRYPGSKWKIADWIISHIPSHKVYLEPFFGSGAVFFRKTPSRIETINDRCGQVVNLFRIIRGRGGELAAAVEMTPYARDEYELSMTPSGEPLEDARRLLIRCWQGFGSKVHHRTGWKINTNGNNPRYYTSSWNYLPERIIRVVDRLKQVQIENRNALELIASNASSDVCIYADPPYLVELHNSTGQYHVEMAEADHVALIDLLDKHPGSVLLSCYDSDLYSERLQHWTKKSTKALAFGAVAREEVLYINPLAAQQIEKSRFTQIGLFRV